MRRNARLILLLAMLLTGFSAPVDVSPQPSGVQGTLQILDDVNRELNGARDEIEGVLIPTISQLVPHLSWDVALELPPPNELRSVDRALPDTILEELRRLGLPSLEIPESQRSEGNRRFVLVRQEPEEPPLGVGLNPWSGKLQGSLCSTDIVVLVKVCTTTPPGSYRKLYDVFGGMGEGRTRVAQLWLEMEIAGETPTPPGEQPPPERDSVVLTVRSKATTGEFFSGAPIDWSVTGEGRALLGQGRNRTPFRLSNIPQNAQIRLKALDADSLTFKFWEYTGAALSENPLVFEITEDATLIAVYQGGAEPPPPEEGTATLTVKAWQLSSIGGPQQLAVAIDGSPSQCGGTTPYSCTVELGTDVSLAAPGFVGFGLFFTGWREGDPPTWVQRSTFTTITVNMNQNRTLAAVYASEEGTAYEDDRESRARDSATVFATSVRPPLPQDALLQVGEIQESLGRALGGLDEALGQPALPDAALDPLQASREATEQAVDDLAEVQVRLAEEIEQHGGESVDVGVQTELIQLSLASGEKIDIAITEKEKGETTLRQMLAPDIEVDPPFSLNFGTVRVGESRSETLEVANVGQADLAIRSISLEAPLGDTPFHFGGGVIGGFTLQPGERRAIEILFAPKRGDQFVDFVVIESNDPDEGTVRVRLRGAGEARSCDEVRSEWQAQNELFQAQKRRCEVLRRQFEIAQDRASRLEGQLRELRAELTSLQDEETGFEEAQEKMEEFWRPLARQHGGISTEDQGFANWVGVCGSDVKIFFKGDAEVGPIVRFIDRNRKRFRELRRECRRTREAERAKARSIEELDREIGRLGETLAAARQESEAARQALEDCQSALERIREQLARLEQEREDCFAAENRLRGVEEQLVEAESAITEAAGSIGRAEESIEAAESQSRQLKSPCEECEGTLGAARDLGDQAKARLSEARTRIEEAQRSLEEARAALEQGDLQGARDRLSEAEGRVEEAADRAGQSKQLAAASQSKADEASREAERRAREERREEERRARARERDRRVLESAKGHARSRAADPETKRKIEDLTRDGELSGRDVQRITEIITNAKEPGKAAAATAQALEENLNLLSTIETLGELMEALAALKFLGKTDALAGFIVTLPYGIIQGIIVEDIFELIDDLIERFSSPCDIVRLGGARLFREWWDGLEDFQQMIILSWFGILDFRMRSSSIDVAIEICKRLKAYEIKGVEVGETESFDIGLDEERLNTITIVNTGKTPMTRVKICFERGVDEDGDEVSLDVGEETEAPNGWDIVEIDRECITLQAESVGNAIPPGAAMAFMVNSEDDDRATRISVTIGKLGIMGDKKFWSR